MRVYGNCIWQALPACFRSHSVIHSCWAAIVPRMSDCSGLRSQKLATPSHPKLICAAESVHEAKLHCLLALHLLGVPLPSSGEPGCRCCQPALSPGVPLSSLAMHSRQANFAAFLPFAALAAADEFQGWLGRQGRRWLPSWAASLACLPPACLGASLCRRTTDNDPLQLRAAELERGGYLWMTRPDAQLGAASPGSGSTHAPASWGRFRRLAASMRVVAPAQPAATGHGSMQQGVSDGVAQSAAGLGGSSFGQGEWQLDSAAGGTVSTFTSSAWAAAPTAAAPAPAPSAGPGAFGVVGGTSLWGIPHGPPSDSMPPPAGAAAAAAATAASAGASLGGTASVGEPRGMEAVHEEGGIGRAAGPPNLLQPSPFDMQQAAAAGAGPVQAVAAAPSARQSGSSKRLSWTLGRLPAASASSQPSQHGTQESSQRASTSAGLQLRPGRTSGSQQYGIWQAAGLAAAAAATEGSPPLTQQHQQQQQGGGPVGAASASLSVLPAQSAAVHADLSQDAQHELRAQHRREELHQQAVAMGLTGMQRLRWTWCPQAFILLLSCPDHQKR